MARRLAIVTVAVLAFTGTVVYGSGAESAESERQNVLDKVQQVVHRKLMSDLKKAQQQAGIFVDDAHLFDDAMVNKGRKLSQTLNPGILSNPAVMGGLMAMVSSGIGVGGFPGSAMGLPGGSNYGYGPSDDSYCLFGTQPYNGGKMTSNNTGPTPGNFACIEGNDQVQGSFVVDFNGQSFTCLSGSAAPTPAGRKLLQAQPSPAALNLTQFLLSTVTQPGLLNVTINENAYDLWGQFFAGIGLPVWNCVVATTPQGPTTLGNATLAVLNDLGVVAEHFLVYLNGNGQLTYQQNIKNNFVSLANPLYPTGPRANFSIPFPELFDADLPLWQEIFVTPATPSPPPPTPIATYPSTTSSSGTTSQASQSQGSQSSSSNQGSSGGQYYGSANPPNSGSGSSNSGSTTVTSGVTTGAVAPVAITATVPTVAPTQAMITAYDGYLSGCQAVIGSNPGTDGNFERISNTSYTITNGQLAMEMGTTAAMNNSVIYVIPASKAIDYAPLTQATASQAQYCYDVATLEPTYNPLASYIMAGQASLAISPLSTLAVFGQSLGVSSSAIVAALNINIPAPDSVFTYDALGQAINGSGTGLAVLNANSQINSLVTAGASALTNDSSLYATFAIIMNQAIAQKIEYSPPSGRRLLQTTPAPAVDLTNATTVASIMNIALSYVYQQDQETQAALTAGLTQQDLAAVSTAVANLNAVIATSQNATAAEVANYYIATGLAAETVDFVNGEESLAQYQSDTSQAAIASNLASTPLPGTLIPQAAVPPAPATVVGTASQSSSSTTHHSGLSTGGKVALAVVLPVVGVIAIVAGIAFYMSRRNGYSSNSSNTVWWRRPFARSGSPSSAV